MDQPVKDTSSACPSCGSIDASPIVYGLMDWETYQANPDIVPGGCCVSPEDRRCRACGTNYRSDGVPVGPEESFLPGPNLPDWVGSGPAGSED